MRVSEQASNQNRQVSGGGPQHATDHTVPQLAAETLRVLCQHLAGGDAENRRSITTLPGRDGQRGKGALARKVRLDPADLGQRPGA